jgi:hypothetical protein
MGYIVGRSFSRQLDFDALIDSICELFPGTSVISHDYYADRIARNIEICKQIGMAIPNPPLDCLERVADEHGIQREIEVPINESIALSGRLDKFGCLFVARHFSLEQVQPLVELLRGTALELEVFGGAE